MQVIHARNSQAGLMKLRTEILPRYFSSSGEDGLRLLGGLTLTVERPQERVLSWPGIGLNPAQTLTDALLSVHNAQAAIDEVAGSLGNESTGFQLVTNGLVVSVQTSTEQGLTMVACTSVNNVCEAVFGPMFLQLSMLQELIAEKAGKGMGSLTLVQTGAFIPTSDLKAIGRPEFDRHWHDPYTLLVVTPEPIVVDETFWSDTTMYLETSGAGVGYTSPFIRKTALPMVHALQCDDKKRALELAGRIKSTDWQRAMVHFIEARG